MLRESCKERGPVPGKPGMHHQLVLIDQTQLGQRQWELHTTHEQSLARLPLEVLNGLAEGEVGKRNGQAMFFLG